MTFTIKNKLLFVNLACMCKHVTFQIAGIKSHEENIKGLLNVICEGVSLEVEISFSTSTLFHQLIQILDHFLKQRSFCFQIIA